MHACMYVNVLIQVSHYYAPLNEINRPIISTEYHPCRFAQVSGTTSFWACFRFSLCSDEFIFSSFSMQQWTAQWCGGYYMKVPGTFAAVPFCSWFLPLIQDMTITFGTNHQMSCSVEFLLITSYCWCGLDCAP